MTDEETPWSERTEDQRLVDVLSLHKARWCAKCGHKIGLGDIAWNNASTEAGTPCSWVEIQCQGCDTEIVRIASWLPEIKDNEDLLNVLEEDWK